MTGLTEQQASALTFIDRFIAAKGFSPSLGEVAAHLGQAPSGAFRVVARLKDRHYLTWRDRSSRTFKVLALPPGAALPLPGAPALLRASDDELAQLRRDLAFEITRRTNAKAIARADALMEQA